MKKLMLKKEAIAKLDSDNLQHVIGGGLDVDGGEDGGGGTTIKCTVGEPTNSGCSCPNICVSMWGNCGNVVQNN